MINCDDAKVLGKEHNKKAREVREATGIRRMSQNAKQEEGTYLLSHVYDP